MKLYQGHISREDVFAIMEKPLPRLTKLDLEIPDGMTDRRIEGPHPFPALKSLILDGGITYLRYFQSSNLRKLGVSCYGWGFQPSSLLKFLARAPLLEELELRVAQHSLRVYELGEDLPPVVLKHLQRIVFRGPRPKFLRSLTSHITHPHSTKIVLTCYLPNNHTNVDSQLFPQGIQLPIPSPPKYIRYRVIHNNESSETSTCIDLISIDGRHTLIENRHGWPRGYSLMEAEFWAARELDRPCLKFLKTINLSSVERLCFERCNPDPAAVGELMGRMDKLESLVVVNGNPYIIFLAMQGLEPSNVMCPLMRQLVVRYDLDIYTQWPEIAEDVETRATRGSPLERVTLTSSFSELFKDSVASIELLEEIVEVRYDLGRSTGGWEWWRVYGRL